MNTHKYEVLVEDLYLTFLTHNDSYMEKVPKGTILEMRNGDLTYNGKISIDNEVGFLYHGLISPFSDNGSRTVL